LKKTGGEIFPRRLRLCIKYQTLCAHLGYDSISIYSLYSVTYYDFTPPWWAF